MSTHSIAELDAIDGLLARILAPSYEGKDKVRAVLVTQLDRAEQAAREAHTAATESIAQKARRDAVKRLSSADVFGAARLLGEAKKERKRRAKQATSPAPAPLPEAAPVEAVPQPQAEPAALPVESQVPPAELPHGLPAESGKKSFLGSLIGSTK